MQGGPLLLLQPAVLFVTGDSDDLCNLSHLRQVCKEMQSYDVRFVVMKVIGHLYNLGALQHNSIASTLHMKHCLFVEIWLLYLYSCWDLLVA